MQRKDVYSKLLLLTDDLSKIFSTDSLTIRKSETKSSLHTYWNEGSDFKWKKVVDV